LGSVSYHPRVLIVARAKSIPEGYSRDQFETTRVFTQVSEK
jgi:hypothetical protein